MECTIFENSFKEIEYVKNDYMSKFKIVNLFDKIFITTSVFLLIYAWINFFIRDLWTTFILSLIFASACVFLLFYLINKKNEKKMLTKEYLKNIEEKFLAFQILNKNEKINLLKSLIVNTSDVKTLNDSLMFFKEQKWHQIMIKIDCEKLNQFQLAKLIAEREKNIENLIIICCEFEPSLNTKILKNLSIELVDKKRLYDEFFLPQNIFPSSSNLNTQNPRKKIREIVKNFFTPRKAKSFFLCGLILIFSSIILPYHLYYLIFGSTLLIFSVICKLQPLFKR